MAAVSSGIIELIFQFLLGSKDGTEFSTDFNFFVLRSSTDATSVSLTIWHCFAFRRCRNWVTKGHSISRSIQNWRSICFQFDTVKWISALSSIRSLFNSPKPQPRLQRTDALPHEIAITSGQLTDLVFTMSVWSSCSRNISRWTSFKIYLTGYNVSILSALEPDYPVSTFRIHFVYNVNLCSSRSTFVHWTSHNWKHESSLNFRPYL